MLQLRVSGGELLLPVRVTPKGGKDCVLPFEAGDISVKLKVSAPPEDGKANAAVIQLLSETLEISKTRFRIARGGKAREKQVAIKLSDAERDVFLERLSTLLGVEAFRVAGV